MNYYVVHFSGFIILYLKKIILIQSYLSQFSLVYKLPDKLSQSSFKQTQTISVKILSKNIGFQSQENALCRPITLRMRFITL